jgi:myo-inositol catabolism protein IolC
MDQLLFILAFDHRASFLRSFFGVTSEPTGADLERARRAKDVIWSGLERAVDGGSVDRSTVGALMDSTYGRGVIEAARTRGLRYAVPLEESGRDELAFETLAWRERLEEFDPAWAKVLVRYNPDGDRPMNERQRAKLAEVSAYCRTTGRGFMLEMLVPAVAEQLRGVGNDPDRYDREIRPALVTTAIEEMQASGIEPDLWKLEGFEERTDGEAVARAARSNGREHVGCLVLGRGADRDAVDRWLAVAAGVEGFVGFAVGRSIWWEPLRRFFEEEERGEARDAAEVAIAEEFARLVDVFLRRTRRTLPT